MADTPVTAYLSLGSNVGARTGNLRDACRLLDEGAIHLKRVSSIYETEPVGFVEQEWFVNCAVEIETFLSPLALLDKMQAIEYQLGRRREIPKGPRTIDIDLLLYGDRTIESERLLLPHPEMFRRRFVMEPLREIAPSLRVPVIDQSVDEIYEELRDTSQVRQLGPLDLTRT